MRLYFEVARRGYRRYSTYRGATIGGLFTNTVFGFMRGYILLTLFRFRPHVGGYSVSDTLTYTWLTQGLIMIVYIWGWFEVALRIRSGDIATDLYRPLDLQGYWLSQDLGRAAYHAIFRGIPPFLIGWAVFRLHVPTSPVIWLAFSLSLVLAVVLSFAIRFLINLAAFWLIEFRGVAVVTGLLSSLLSGFVIPLTFFPHWAAASAHLLPWAGMIQIPIDVFLGKYAGAQLVGALGLQLGWATVILIAGRFVLRAGTRRLVVQGG